MVKEIRYTSIKRVLDNLLDHPLLRDLTLEQVIRYTIRFISIHGYPKLFEDKIENVKIEDFRGLLPCDLISIIQVKDSHTGICLRAMTNTFTPALLPEKEKPQKINTGNKPFKDWYIPATERHFEEPSFKTQGRVIFTSFPEGEVTIAYKSIPVDENGFPLLIDNENYLAALEAYIKKQVFTIKFDTGKIAAGVLDNAKQEYAWLAGQLAAEMVMPSISEMQSITNMLNTLIPNVRAFDSGFINMGDREYLRKH